MLIVSHMMQGSGFSCMRFTLELGGGMAEGGGC